MNKKFSTVLYLLILANILIVCSSVFIVFSTIVLSYLQDMDRYNHDTSPQRILVKALGEDKRELINECLREHRENQPWGELIYVNSLSECALWTINGFLGVVSCCLAFFLLASVREAKIANSDAETGVKKAGESDMNSTKKGEPTK